MGLAELRGFKTKKEAEAYLQGYKDSHQHEKGEDLPCGIVIYQDLSKKTDEYIIYLD